MAAQAAHDPARVWTTLAHLIDEDWLREASRRTRKSSAAGIAGVTAQQYAAHLEETLRALHERLRSGVDHAAPVERGWIATDDGGRRPIGQPAFEDTMVQRAVARLLEAIYAQDFSDGSYGFRPGRSPHAARHERRERCMTEGMGGIVDAEGRGAFARIDRTRRREVLRQRVHDGRVLRLMGQWVRAGVMAEGVLRHPETGVVQGGVIAPLRAPIFLPHVLEAWLEPAVRARMQGRGLLIRFADDCVIGGALAGDARRIMAVLPKRCARCGLRMHPTQTALLACRKPEAHPGSAPGNGPCDLLGLPHSWSRSRRGFGGSKRRTARKRLCRTQQALWRWGHIKRHAPMQSQSQQLCQQ